MTDEQKRREELIERHVQPIVETLQNTTLSSPLSGVRIILGWLVRDVTAPLEEELRKAKCQPCPHIDLAETVSIRAAKRAVGASISGASTRHRW